MLKNMKRSTVAYSYILSLENGLIKNPRFELIIDIGEALGLSLDDMKEAYVAQNKSDD